MSIKRTIFFSEALLFAATAFLFTGCNNSSSPNSASTDQTQPAAPDQSVSQPSSGGASSQPVQSNESPQQAEASGNLVQASAGNDQNYSDDNYDADDQDSSYGQPVLQAEQPPPPLP
jgi:hypothetical protein